MVADITHKSEKQVKELDDQTRDAARFLCPPPMLDAPATLTACNGVNGDNESRRQRSIYTAFEKAKATHVCFLFRPFGEWDVTCFNQVIEAVTPTLAVRKTESRTWMVGPSL